MNSWPLWIRHCFGQHPTKLGINVTTSLHSRAREKKRAAAAGEFICVFSETGLTTLFKSFCQHFIGGHNVTVLFCKNEML